MIWFEHTSMPPYQRKPWVNESVHCAKIGCRLPIFVRPPSI
jgi:hypothetical protein